MNKSIHLLLFTLLFFFVQDSFSQSKKEEAYNKAIKAIELMDNGSIEESITLLKEAQKLDPDKYNYSYELAYAYLLKKDYSTALKIAEKLTSHENATDELYQLMGNTYDYMGKPEKAIATYDAGLKKFPTSGSLYLEKGNMFLMKKEYNDALSFYEKGIELDPTFPSNYYRAALLYCNSTEEVWGMIYGEIFMNLERNTKRTAEISKLLYDTYKSEIKMPNDTSYSVSFCQQMNINIAPGSDPNKLKLPFGMLYEGALTMALIEVKEINLNSLDLIRTKFLQHFTSLNKDNQYPNVLFDYENEIVKAGHFEAYNYWLLMKGDEDAFDEWYKTHEEPFQDFIKWFKTNNLKLSDVKYFYRGQY